MSPRSFRLLRCVLCLLCAGITAGLALLLGQHGDGEAAGVLLLLAIGALSQAFATS
jgi:hypothetical protein